MCPFGFHFDTNTFISRHVHYDNTFAKHMSNLTGFSPQWRCFSSLLCNKATRNYIYKEPQGEGRTKYVANTDMKETETGNTVITDLSPKLLQRLI